MFTDMVGYTALAQKDEPRALKVLEDHRRFLAPILRLHHGMEVKTMGDSYLIEFDSALDATNCAIDIQKRLHERNVSANEWKIRLRIGVHLGDVLRVKGDVLGDTVNVASRVEPLADAGGICVSEQVFDQVRNKISLPLLKLAPRDLKNVQFPVDIYKIVMPWEESVAGSVGETPTAQRVAVLPFTNMSPDPADEYFADGMTEEIISALSKIEQAEVISRTSVMQYKKTAKPVKDVSKELGVGTILEGSVRKAGNRLRVSVQMIDATRDRHLWSESYNRELEDVFAIQTDIAQRVADVLQTRVLKDEDAAREPLSIEAYSIFLRAMQLSHDNAEASLREAIELFEKVIVKEPGFVRAYAGLAHALCGLASGYADFKSSVEKAETVAKNGLKLGPHVAEAFLAMAYVHTYMDKFDLAVAEAEKAIQINPNLSEAYSTLGWISASMGKLDAGIESLRKARRLDPLSFRPGSEVSLVFQLAGSEQEALQFLESSRDLYPKNHRVYARWAEYYLLKRDYVKAQEVLAAGLQISPDDVDLLTDQGVLYAVTGKRNEADEVLHRIWSSPIEESRLQGQLFVNAAQGDLDGAFEALFRLAEIHAWPPLVKSLPVFEEMRRDPRFPEFCQRVGLPLTRVNRIGPSRTSNA